MDNQVKSCSSKEHGKIPAVSYCQFCRVYMCNKSLKIHKDLYNHTFLDIQDDDNDIFEEYCEEENHHSNKLDFYCKTHNKLYCAACISKIKFKENGKHSDCDICTIEDVKNEKKNKLKENIANLEELSIKLDETISELRKIYEKIYENKEILKTKVQTIFTKFRNILNDRQDFLLSEIDSKTNILFFDENKMKESEKLPKNVLVSLEKGKLIEDNWKEKKLVSLINDCILIEKNIKDIKTIKQKNKLFKNLNCTFYPKELGINEFIENIKNFGEISFDNFKFKEYKGINEFNKYDISGDLENIVIKTGNDQQWISVICKNEFEKDKIYTWKIKIRKTKECHIMVGVAPAKDNQNILSRLSLPKYIKINNQNQWGNFGFNTNKAIEYNNLGVKFGSLKQFDKNINSCGWYFYCFNSTLYSDLPQKYNGKETNIKHIDEEITIIMNMEKRSLQFIIDNNDLGESYNDLPINEPLTPAILLYDKDDSVEIITC